MAERWKKFDKGTYAISDRGRLMRVKKGPSTRPGKILKAAVHHSGYCQVALWSGEKRFNLLIHRLVARAFIGSCPDGMEVNHIDGDKENNDVGNLEYVTRSDNIRHAYQLGLRSQAGENNNQAILTQKDVEQIRKEYIPYKKPLRIFAKRYGISCQAVHLIIQGKNWQRSN